jgi:hypothetical protein
MWKAIVAHIVVVREGIKNILHSKVEKLNGLWNWILVIFVFRLTS